MNMNVNVVTKDDWTPPRTGLVCFAVAYVVYVFRLFNHLYFDRIEAALRKVTGLKSAEEKPPRQPVELGPFSYKPLIFSVLACSVWLSIIWLIKITPFQRLYRSSPLYKLVQILLNSPELEREEEERYIGGSAEQTAKHQQILNTCMELERRIRRLEECLTPMARSLQTLNDVIDSQSGARFVENGPADSQIPKLTEFPKDQTRPAEGVDQMIVQDQLRSHVTDRMNDLLETHADLLDLRDVDVKTTDPPDSSVNHRPEIRNPSDSPTLGHD